MFWSRAHCIHNETRDWAQSRARTKVLHPIPLKTEDVEGSGGPRGTGSSQTSLSPEDSLDAILKCGLFPSWQWETGETERAGEGNVEAGTW